MQWQVQQSVRADNRSSTNTAFSGSSGQSLSKQPASVVDPSCPMCHRVRLALLGIAYLMVQDLTGSADSLMCNVDSHSNSILCLPALGNRSAVSVSINVRWKAANGQALEMDLQGKLKAFLAKHGIHQR